MKRMMIILIVAVGVLLLSAKVIYQFEPEKSYQLKPKTMKSKSAEFLQTHKENYMRYLEEKTDLNYVTTQKVDTKGDSVKKYSSILYEDRINIKKLNELRKLGLVNYTLEQLQYSQSPRFNTIALHTLAYRILSSNFIFIGTVHSSLTPFDPTGRYNTKVVVSVDEFINGTYYFEDIPKSFNVYCIYGTLLDSEDYYLAEEFSETELKVGQKYIFFANKYLKTKEESKYLNKMDILMNRESAIYSIKGNKINDINWNFPQSLEYQEIIKLKEFIKLLEKTNETEKFFDIEFK